MSTPTITSPKNARVQAAVKLRRRKHRANQHRTLVDGIREIRRAFQGGAQLAELFVCPPLCGTEESERLCEQASRMSAPIYEVTTAVFEKLTFGDRAEGVVAVIDSPSHTLSEIALPHQPLVAVVEAVEKPGNLGAVIRSADSAGISAVIAADAQTDLHNPGTIRASLGTVFTMPVAAAASGDVLAWLRNNNLAICAARVAEGPVYTEIDWRRPTAIVLGTETSGLSETWHASDITPVQLPMCGAADSLNVAATAAVLFYEALRQRGQKVLGC